VRDGGAQAQKSTLFLDNWLGFVSVDAGSLPSADINIFFLTLWILGKYPRGYLPFQSPI